MKASNQAHLNAYMQEWLSEQDCHSREALQEVKHAVLDAPDDNQSDLEAYIDEWLAEQDIYALEAWNEVNHAIFDALW